MLYAVAEYNFTGVFWEYNNSSYILNVFYDFKIRAYMNFVDLFAGAGGLSEGFIQAGFHPIAHVESDFNACETLRTRAAYHYLNDLDKAERYQQYISGEISKNSFLDDIPESLLASVINAEINKDNLTSIFDQIDNRIPQEGVDLIIGGPPCQAYSAIGRARDPKGMKGDQRNYLFRFYAKFLERYRPKIFLFENVLGLISAKNGEYLRRMRSAFFKVGYRTDYKQMIASDFGVVQNRKRIIMIGWRIGDSFTFPEFTIKRPNATVYELLRDLPNLEPGDRNSVLPYSDSPHRYTTEIGLRNEEKTVTLNYTHGHNARDLLIYRLAIRKWLDEGKRLYYDDIPKNLQTHKNTRSFTDRFKVVNGAGNSHTVVAHAGKDGHYYIYPSLEQIRSMSCRELARIQSFPDNYFFEGGMGSIYKQIGNAVPPLMANRIANKIMHRINTT